MTRDESIALWRQGKGAWNAWAERMLAEKKALEDEGKWAATKDYLGDLKPQNDDTRDWLARSSADFSRCLFACTGVDGSKETAGEVKREDDLSQQAFKTLSLASDDVNFSGFVFPGGARFVSGTFTGPALFTSATFTGDARFDGATLTGDTWFVGATFTGDARFDGATFTGDPWFDHATFTCAAQFDDATFMGAPSFASNTFTGNASFANATFTSAAWFAGATFTSAAWFAGATFTGAARFAVATFTGVAWFADATFTGAASFADATFKARTSFAKVAFGTKKNQQDAIFTGIKVERAFDMTGAAFSKAPAFNQADFAQAPDLDDVTYPQPPFFRFWVRGWENEAKTLRRADKFKADAAKYRHLRRLSILGHDHENESKAFKGETRAKRGTEHYPWLAAFWFGVGYDALSDFGRSMMRPFYAWAVLTAAFAVFYLATASLDIAPPPKEAGWAASNFPMTVAALSGELRCKGKDLSTITPIGEAAYLAIKNGLIVIGLGSEGKINQAHACLYGGSITEPVFPSGLSVWQIAQNLLSAPLIFLFLLGVRNQFKIK